MDFLEEETAIKQSFPAYEILIVIGGLAMTIIAYDSVKIISLMALAMGPLFMFYMIRRAKKLTTTRSPPFKMNFFFHIFHLLLIGTLLIFMLWELTSFNFTLQSFLMVGYFIILIIDIVLLYYYILTITG